MRRSPLVVAGIIFSIVALMHLLRIIYHWQVLIAGYIIPTSVSIIAFILTIVLALWMFSAAAKK
jgi:hypothetical protein